MGPLDSTAAIAPARVEKYIWLETIMIIAKQWLALAGPLARVTNPLGIGAKRWSNALWTNLNL
jgi:hypothetical protein